MNLDHYSDLTDSTGAVSILAQRFNRPYTREALHWLVKRDKIRALMFENGTLVERKPDASTRGKDLFFLRSNVEAMAEPKRGPVSKTDG